VPLPPTLLLALTAAPQAEQAPMSAMRVPAALVANMAAPAHRDSPTEWDYKRDPYPPCSFG